MVEGFQRVIDKLDEKPVAISFAFPGPADYPNGIIGGYLPNFPSFRDGVALGPFLEMKFGILVASASINQVDERTGKEEVTRCQQAVPGTCSESY